MFLFYPESRASGGRVAIRSGGRNRTPILRTKT
jgi:hypothetical protein